MPSINAPDVAGLDGNSEIQYCEKSMGNIWRCLSKLRIKEGNIASAAHKYDSLNRLIFPVRLYGRKPGGECVWISLFLTLNLLYFPPSRLFLNNHNSTP